MPKYFEGEKALPFPRVDFLLSELSENALREALASHNHQVSICLKLPGFPVDSLGYLFFVVQNPDGSFHLQDLARSIAIKTESLGKVESFLRHCSGAAFSQEWYDILYAMRNDRQQAISD
jgi:hypothetical protein